MYNEDIKREFIQTITTRSRQEAAIRLFKASEEVEVNNNADLYTMDQETVLKILKSLSGVRSSGCRVFNTIANNYSEWCIKKSFSGTQKWNIKTIEPSLEKVRKQSVANPEHLQKYLDCVFEPECNLSSSNIWRCYFWLAYSGMSETDALLVKDKEVDLFNMVVKHNSREYPIYEEGIEAFKNCVEMKELVCIRNDDIVYTKSRGIGDILLRTRGEFRTPESLRIKVSTYTRDPRFKSKEEMIKYGLDIRLSYKRALMSGMFYRMYEAEKIGIPPDTNSIAADLFDMNPKNNVVSEKDRRKRIATMANYYKRDYEIWKSIYAYISLTDD